jgi:transcriptional regulator with PAS, ATPase and Fis domain
VACPREDGVHLGFITSADDPQTITGKDLCPLLADSPQAGSVTAAMNQPFSMEQMERLTIQQALRQAEGNRTKAASLLGYLARHTLQKAAPISDLIV